LIVLDIRDSRRQARRILQRNQTIYLAAFSETISGGSATLSGGSRPSIEQRIEVLEDRVRALNER